MTYLHVYFIVKVIHVLEGVGQSKFNPKWLDYDSNVWSLEYNARVNSKHLMTKILFITDLYTVAIEYLVKHMICTQLESFIQNVL